MNPEFRGKQTFRSTLTVDAAAMKAFTALSGDTNPIHLDDESAQAFGFPRQVAYVGVLLAEISRIIGTRLPGPGALCVSYQFDFAGLVYVGDSVEFEVTVAHYSLAMRAVVLKFKANRQPDDTTVLRGSATVRVPDGDTAPVRAKQDERGTSS